jgi:phage terminase large subunit-like protein
MVSGMGAREQPLLLVITTAGTDLASPCRDKHLEAERVLQGTLENDEMFAIIFTIDEEDDWTSSQAIRKANPNLNKSVDEGFLLAQQKQAIANPAHQNRFKTKHLNIWCGASVAGINSADWNKAADPTLTLEQFNGEEAIFALDLASKLDICDFVQLFTKQINGALHYYAFARHYIPEDTIEEARVNQLAYRKWVAQGHLIATEGAEIDFDEIRADVSEYRSRFQAKEVVYDPWRATQLAHQLAKDGATVVEMGQTAKNMAAAFDELLTALKAGRFHHDGDPVLAWMAGNVVAKSVAKGVTVPSKEKPDQKIDGIVAIVMAIARAVAGVPEAPEYSIFVL